ncbi:MAG: Glutathione S-transferase GST-6.0 [Alphaproteobacteria bacterium MarineAlpha10_Bin3]|jgi:glutathione S-transferase|nr:MAG: Glutathione S-transferase GST-6.0 [Alphaproteobacteria bacterium MarineAlpha10_Bin3]PPR73864.1 MAG: Glutathione S-transferase GST-6.0 [Alphaproteobacteria bacterium MarineAlpha4_Bin1]
MKLYTSKVAPNPRRVHIFLAEKGVEIESVEIDLGESQNLDPDFVARNPLGRVPVLELDDGAYLAESMAICRYFEETHPEPPLMGIDVRDKAMVEMWNRRMEFEIMAQISGCFRHTHRYWEGRIPQIPEYGELCRKTVLERMAWLDGELADREFIAGDRFTVADITAFTAISLGRIPKIRIAEELTNLQRWFDAVRARPSVG